MEPEKLKVVLFSTQWPEYMVELANSLSYKVDLYLVIANNSRWSNRHEKLLNKDVKVYYFENINYRSIRKNAILVLKIQHILNRISPKIIHLQANGHRWFWSIFLLSLFKSRIFINTIHDPVVHKGDLVSMTNTPKWTIYLGRFFCKRYIVHGEYLRRQLSKVYRIKIG